MPLEPDHTPGPWKVIRSPHGSEYRCVQLGADEMYTTLEMKPPDAQLIATAPAMLAELEWFHDEMKVLVQRGHASRALLRRLQLVIEEARKRC